MALSGEGYVVKFTLHPELTWAWQKHVKSMCNMVRWEKGVRGDRAEHVRKK